MIQLTREQDYNNEEPLSNMRGAIIWGKSHRAEGEQYKQAVRSKGDSIVS